LNRAARRNGLESGGAAKRAHLSLAYCGEEPEQPLIRRLQPTICQPPSSDGGQARPFSIKPASAGLLEWIHPSGADTGVETVYREARLKPAYPYFSAFLHRLKTVADEGSAEADQENRF